MTQAGLDQRHVLQSGLHAGESIEKKRRKIGGGGSQRWMAPEFSAFPDGPGHCLTLMRWEGRCRNKTNPNFSPKQETRDCQRVA